MKAFLLLMGVPCHLSSIFFLYTRSLVIKCLVKKNNFFYFCVKSVPATVNGMLGGYGHISPTDIKDSKRFLKNFLDVSCI